MKQTPHAIAAAVKPGAGVPLLSIGALYSLKLTDQAGVAFAAEPAKRQRCCRCARGPRAIPDWESGPLPRVHLERPLDRSPGRCAGRAIDFQGHVGCERPSKIVEFDLPAEHDLTLQFSGSSDAEVFVAITAVGASSAS